MKIVIDIPEEVKQTFDNAKNEDLYGNYYDYNSLIGKAIRNGTPLPKGHGRLLDEKEVYKKFYSRCLAKVAKEILSETDTIIEADNAESEET